MILASAATIKEEIMTGPAMRVTVRFPEEEGREQVVPMLKVDLVRDVSFIACDPMYEVSEEFPDLETVISYLSDLAESKEIIRIGLPDGVVLQVSIEVTRAEVVDDVWEIVLSVTPMYPVMPWPWGPRRGYGWYGGDE